MKPKKSKDGWITVEGPVSVADLRSLAGFGHIEKLSIVRERLVTAKLSKAFEPLISVNQFWLGCDITRTVQEAPSPAHPVPPGVGWQSRSIAGDADSAMAFPCQIGKSVTLKSDMNMSVWIRRIS